MPDHRVEFQVNPNAFGDALKETSRNLTLSDGTLFVCAIESTSSSLYEQQSCSEDDAELESDARLVLGLAGKGGAYKFTEMPALSVEEEGMFVLGRVEELQQWADVAGQQATFTYEAEGTDNHLRIDYPDGHDKIEIIPFYREDQFSQYFDCHQERFYTPEDSLYQEDFAELIGRAKKIAPSSDRTGDLCFQRAGGEPRVYFHTRQRIKRVVVATSQQTALPEDYPLADFEWEVTPEQLASLKRLVNNETATGQIREKTNPRTEDTYNELQAAYQTTVSDDTTLYVHYKTSAFRNNPPIEDWTGGESIFENENCKLFSTVETSKLKQNLNTTWALKSDKIICAEPTRAEDDSPIMKLYTYSGSGDSTDEKRMPITPGESSIDQYYFMPSVQNVLEKVVGDSRLTQIRSFPAGGGERPNGYVITPLSEDTSPTDVPTQPDRYAIVTWQQE